MEGRSHREVHLETHNPRQGRDTNSRGLATNAGEVSYKMILTAAVVASTCELAIDPCEIFHTTHMVPSPAYSVMYHACMKWLSWANSIGA